MDKKTFIKLVVIGFAMGTILGNLIEIILNLIQTQTFSFASDIQIATFGLPLTIVLQTLLSGLFGAICFAGTAFYEIEKWSIAVATLVHYLCILATYFAIGFLLRWIPFDVWIILIIIGSFTIAFFIVWLIMYLRWKKRINEMNNDLQNYQKGGLDNENK